MKTSFPMKKFLFVFLLALSLLAPGAVFDDPQELLDEGKAIKATQKKQSLPTPKQ